MMLGIVTGTVVSTVQHGFYSGKKQLIVRKVRPNGEFDGDSYVVALDMVGAGVGERVLIQDEGNSARQVMGLDSNGPVRTLVIGIVDDVTKV